MSGGFIYDSCTSVCMIIICKKAVLWDVKYTLLLVGEC